MIESVSEKKIVENYVTMVVNEINETNDYFDLDGENQLSYPSMPYWVIVQRLLLWGTTHSGRTSSIEKCIELGLDPYECPFDKYKDE